MIEEKLDKLIEDCSEVTQAAIKIKRFGINNWHPESKRRNGDHLLDEIMDLNETVKEVRELLPRPSIQEMVLVVKKWFNRSTLREQAEFTETAFEDLVVFHSTLGQQIRNYFNLWHYKWVPSIKNDIDISEEHPDAVSMKVIEQLWREIKND
jgi:hypothetical protein